MSSSLEEAIADRSAGIVIWGAGYTGLGTASAVLEAGFRCRLIDTNTSVLNSVRSHGTSLRARRQVPTVPLEAIRSGRLELASDHDAGSTTDWPIHVICVNTESAGEADPGSLRAVLSGITAGHSGVRLISIESTIVPSWLDDWILPMCASYPSAGAGIELGCAPRRDWLLSPGLTLQSIPRVVGGTSPRAARALVQLYETICDRVLAASDARTAALVKVIENALRLVDLALVNELVVSMTGSNVREALELAGTKWNVPEYYPSLGVGGYCVPLSAEYLLQDSAMLANGSSLIRAARLANQRHFAEISGMLSSFVGTRVAILGLSYAPDVFMVNGSTSLAIAEHLRRQGHQVFVHDPLLDPAEIDASSGFFPFEYPSGLGSMDAVIVATPHTQYLDLPQRLAECSNPPLIIDNFGTFKVAAAAAGLRYLSVGDGSEEWTIQSKITPAAEIDLDVNVRR